MLPEAILKHLTAEAARCPSTFQPSVLVVSGRLLSILTSVTNENADLHIGRSWSRYARWRRDQRIERARVRRAKRGHR